MAVDDRVSTPPDEALRQAVLYLLRENRRDRESYPMDTTEVDAHLEALAG